MTFFLKSNFESFQSPVKLFGLENEENQNVVFVED